MTPNMMMNLMVALSLVNLGAIATTAVVVEERLADTAMAEDVADLEVQPDPIGNSYAMFIKFDGIDGESKDADHEKWIDVLAWKHERSSVIDDEGNMVVGSGSVTFVKELDKSSTKLASLLSDGGHPDCIFAHVKVTPPETVRMSGTMENTTVRSIITTDFVYHSGDEADGSMVIMAEMITVDYESITWTYTDGSLEHTDDWIVSKGIAAPDPDPDPDPEPVMAAYIKIGDIKGESKDKGHTDEIDVLAWSWGIHRPGGGATGQSRSRGEVTLGDVVVVKEIDKSTPKLAEAVGNGTPMDEVVLYIEMLDPASTEYMPYMTVELENVTFESMRRPLDPATVSSMTGWDEGGPGGLRYSGFPGAQCAGVTCLIDTSTPVETIEFDFAMGNITYHGANENGTDIRVGVLPWMAPESISTKFYAKYDGFPGEAPDRGREDTYNLEDFELTISGGTQGLETPGRESTPIVITKRVDGSSPMLMNSLNGGTTFNMTVYADEIKTMSNGSMMRTEYMAYELKNVIVTSYQTGGSGGEDSLMERFTLIYDEVKVAQDGGPKEHLYVWAMPPDPARVDMFIKIGEIKGEARASGHKDEIDVLAWSWGLTQDTKGHVGGGGGSGKANYEDLSFTKFVDKSSPALMQAYANGEDLGNGTFTLYRSGESEPFVSIEMISMQIASISTEPESPNVGDLVRFSSGDTVGQDQFKNKGRSSLFERVHIKPIRLDITYHDGGPGGGDIKVVIVSKRAPETNTTEITMAFEGLEGINADSFFDVFTYDQQQYIPTDVHSGKLTGVRMHSPFRLSKPIDSSSPSIQRAFSSGDEFDVNVVLDRVSSDGEKTTYFKYKLTNAIITSYSTGGSGGDDSMIEEFSLNYEKITYEYTELGIEMDEDGMFELPPASAIYIKIGDIKGETKDKDHKDWIDVLSIDWGISNTRDAASGLPTGKRQHKPVMLAKAIDKASPKLQEALINGDEMNITFELWTSDVNGTMQHDMTVNLTGTQLLSMDVEHRGHVTVVKGMETDGHVTVLKAWEHRGHVTVLKGKEDPPTSTEMVSLNYREIEVTYEQTGESFFDVWTEIFEPPTRLAFAKFDGIDGESKDKHHSDWSDLDDVEWEINEYLEPDTGRQTGILHAQDVYVTKYIDKSSPLLAQRVGGKTHINVTIEQYRVNESSDTGMDHFLTLNLWNASILSVNYVDIDSDDDDIGTEEGIILRLRFETLDVTWEQYGIVQRGIDHLLT